MAIGLGLILGIFAYAASFFGAFVMINYILADMIFTYPLQLAFFIILLMSHSLLAKVSLKEIIAYFRDRNNRGEDKHDPLTNRGWWKDIVDICQTYFEYEGYQVTTTTCGKEALKLLSSDIDIMILDIMMPEVSGYDIVKNERYATWYTFHISNSKTQEHDTIYALTLGADDYIKTL